MGISYQKLLDSDTRPVPEVLRLESGRELLCRLPVLKTLCVAAMASS